MKQTFLRISLMAFTAFFSAARAQTVMPLYNKIPNSKEWANEETSVTDQNGVLRISKVSVPTLTMYTPAKPNGTAVIICPGGGYAILAASHEGSDVARRFNEMGVTAFVLKYRLPSDNTMQDRHLGPVQDAQRAIQMVRENARPWHIKPNKIGLMGFSAGGHLASTAGTHFNSAYIDNQQRTSLRPDFLMLVYPVISMADSLTHMGSKTNLVGRNADAARVALFSNDRQVTRQTPPTFLVHAKDDKAVPVQNSLAFANAMRAHRQPVEVYLYDAGGHGFGMHNKTSEVQWMGELERWLQQRKLVKKK